MQMKKKYLICLIMLLLSFVFVDNKVLSTFAAESFETSTYTPTISQNETVSNYINLDNITYFTVQGDWIYYTLDGTSLKMYNTNTKVTESLNHTFTSIDYITNAFGYIFVSDNKTLKPFKNSIHLENAISSKPNAYDHISMYEKGDALYISYIKDDCLFYEVYSFDYDTMSFSQQSIKKIYGTDHENIFNDVTMFTSSYNKVFFVSSVSSSNVFYVGSISDVAFTYKTERAFDTLNAKKISYISYETLDLLVVIGERLKIYDTVNEMYLSKEVRIHNNGLNAYTTGQLCSPQFVDIHDNLIYVSDKYGTSKNIQSFTVGSEGLVLDKTILASLSHDVGRFYNAEDVLYKDSTTMYVADTKNNRIQIFTANGVTVLDDFGVEYTNAYPKSLMLDEYNNLYFTISSDSNKSNILKYDGEDILVVRENASSLADTTITYNNVIYAIDYINHKVIRLNDDGTATPIYSNSNTFSNKAKIEHITYLDALLIYDQGKFTLLDNLGNEKSTKTITGVIDYTVDHSGNVYLMTNTAMYSIRVASDYTINTAPSAFTYTGDFSIYSTLTLNTSSNTLYLFNSDRQCIESFRSSNILPIGILAPVDAYNNTALTTIDQVLPAKITSTSLIYEYPYNLGTMYNTDDSIKNLLVVGSHEDYYYVLFNHNNSLTSGYIKKDRVTIQSIVANEKDVITTNDNVTIYKYPTILKHNGNIFSEDALVKNMKITVSSLFPVSIDNKNFYIYEYEEKIGFICSADVVIGTSHIDYLPTLNATIHIIDKTDCVVVYTEASSESETIATLENNRRIYIDMESYDKTSEYTLITYIDDNENAVSGYIKTNNIKPDGVDTNSVILIVIIVVTIVIFLALVITFYQIKKKRKLYN